MVEGIYNNAASLTALERWQSVISQNLAASNVAGFKKMDFAIETDDEKKTQYAQEEFGGLRHTGHMPSRTTSINFSNGDHKPTGKPTDFAIDGDGFFQIRGADGQPLFTRDGEFHFNQNNTLVTKNGLEVVGDAGPIVLDPEQGAFTVARDGTISQGDNAIGRLALYEIEDTAGLTRVEGGYFQAPEGVNPAALEEFSVLQGVIEGSNVVPMAELVSLIAVSRAYEASQRAMRSHDDLITKAINSLGTPNA
jgi:flagellar basal-body rod protein FlgF